LPDRRTRDRRFRPWLTVTERQGRDLGGLRVGRAPRASANES